ncbi:pseudaminic acid synthase [Thiohalospira halophila]|nr:pseudaminic acid synthase [Thiohalospira halophila]
MSIAGRPIGNGHPPLMVAELSANHDGSLERALAIVDAAAEAGADAIKLQTYRPDTMTLDVDRPEFFIEAGRWAGESLYQLYERAHTPWEWHEALFQRARERGLIAFSSPFDATAVDFLEGLDCPAYKIASFEAVDLELIQRVAATGKPVILSTGMADAEEIATAVATAREAGCNDLALLHCVSAYPAEPAEYNLRTLPDLARRFSVVAGLSDHTRDNTTAIAAVALGATIVEKHFTLDRAGGGPDDDFSLEPAELAALCRDAWTAWQALGKVSYERSPSEQGSMAFRRSLYFVADIAAGETITEDHIRAIRPGYGAPPSERQAFLGRRARQAIARGTPASWELVE